MQLMEPPQRIKADGWAALLDAGSHSNRRQMIPRIREHGVEPEDIRYIFLTHLHWDHANNVDLFPQAELFVSRPEWEFATNEFDFAYYPPTIEMLQKRHPTIIGANGEMIVEGVRAYLTPGHSVGSTSYAVEMNGETYVLAGDAVKNWYEIESGTFKMTRDPEISRRSAELIRSLGSHILPGHDGWVDLVEGRAVPRGDNDVTLTFPKGITMNNASEICLYMDRP